MTKLYTFNIVEKQNKIEKNLPCTTEVSSKSVFKLEDTEQMINGLQQ